MNKKKIFIIIAVLVILVGMGIFFLFSNSSWRKSVSTPTATFKVEYLEAAEQAKLGIAPELKVQAIKRNEAGGLMIYKIIKSDQDVVTNIDSLNSLRPPRAEKK